MFINIYNILIRFLYPLAIRPYINKRKEHGKEDVKRFNERIGKPKLPMIHAAIALVADVIAMALLLVFTNLGVYTIVIAQIVYAVVMCLLNDRSIKKYMGYKNPWRSAYLSPFLASIPMGVVAGVVYYGLYALIHSNVICLGISVILAAGVYFIVYLFVSKPGEEELGMMPGGRYMKKLARMMKII